MNRTNVMSKVDERECRGRILKLGKLASPRTARWKMTRNFDEDQLTREMCRVLVSCRL